MVSPSSIEGAKFSDADPGEGYAFELFPVLALRELLFEKFRGQRVLMRELSRFVVQETDYLPSHARKILKKCEHSGDIDIDGLPGYKRPAGTFKDDKVFVRFPKAEPKLLFP